MPKTTHGFAKQQGRATPTYVVWRSMKDRCLNPKVKNYHRYGGRGITICDRWMTFENFLADMGKRPKGMTIERKDSNGNYEPSNCRWASRKEQSQNTSRNVLLTFNGQTKTIAEWAEATGLSRPTIAGRVRMGWPVERILTAVKEEKPRWPEADLQILRQNYTRLQGPSICAGLLPDRSMHSIHRMANQLGLHIRGV